jgi:general secretion pathway protein G
MVSVTILGLLAGLAIPKFQGYMEKARVARCIAEIRHFEGDIFAFYISNERYPNTLNELGRSQVNLTDPWGGAYQYLLIDGTKVPGSGKKVMNDWTPVIVVAAFDGRQGADGGSWFFSEAWAAPGGGGGSSGGGGGSSGGGGGSSGGGGGSSGGGGGSSGGGGGSSGGGGGSSGGGGGSSGGGGGSSGGGGGGQPRKDRFLVPINSDYDLYSMGPDGASTPPLTAKASHDDIIRASDGAYVGVAENF